MTKRKLTEEKDLIFDLENYQNYQTVKTWLNGFVLVSKALGVVHEKKQGYVAVTSNQNRHDDLRNQ